VQHNPQPCKRGVRSGNFCDPAAGVGRLGSILTAQWAPCAGLWHLLSVRTPTPIFAGEQDQRVPMAQSLEWYRALRENGVPTRLIVAPREGRQ
jgi:hypothetical protein